MSEAKDMQLSQIENQSTTGSQNVKVEDHEPFQSPEASAAHKRLLRKIDWRILSTLIPIYSLSLIDRSNLGGARIAGIDEDLGLDQGNRYSLAILLFYITYIFFELPSNMALKKFGAPRWLSALTVLFGLSTLGVGLAQNYATLLALRIILGTMEAGIFPGCIYLIGAWYPRHDVQKRLAAFFSIAAFLSSFANILAYGLTQISDQPERYGWRWIFIVQGAITAGIAIYGWLLMPDFPESKRNKFLSAEEMEGLKRQLLAERGDAEAGKVTWKVIKSTLVDWHTYPTAFIYMGGACGNYSFLFFLPVILRNSFGFSQSLSFCLCAPPAAFGIFASLAISWVSDKVHMRGIFVIAECLVAIAGLAMTGFAGGAIPRYIGTFLGFGGINCLIATNLAWAQNNVRDDAKRSVVTVIQICTASIGGIYSSLVFRNQDAPDYVPGLVAVGALLLLAVVLATGQIIYLRRENGKADRGEKILQESPDFRFVL